MAYPYPTFADARDELGTLRDVIQKRDVPLPKAAHAVYVVTGFGLSVYPGDPDSGPFLGQRPPAQAIGEPEALDLLDQLETSEESTMRSAGAFPWQQLLPFLLILLERIFNQTP